MTAIGLRKAAGLVNRTTSVSAMQRNPALNTVLRLANCKALTLYDRNTGLEHLHFASRPLCFMLRRRSTAVAAEPRDAAHTARARLDLRCRASRISGRDIFLLCAH